MKYPWKRTELKEELSNLADMDYLVKHWVNLDYDKTKYIINFDETVHFFFDDTPLAEDAKLAIGYYLLNEEEAELITKVTDAINVVLEKNGYDLTDREYIYSKEWAGVMEASKNARTLLEANDKK